jgi:hypothetical protein
LRAQRGGEVDHLDGAQAQRSDERVKDRHG